MDRRNGRKDHFAGGIGLLAAAAYLCVRELRKVEERLKKREGKR